MPSYDPRELALRLKISREYNIQIIKDKQKLQIAYNNLLDNYTKLVKYFIMDRQNRMD
jgi:hypothetical protein